MESRAFALKRLAALSAASLAAVLGLGTAAVIAPQTPFIPHASADYAPQGDGYFKNTINWIEWPTTPNNGFSAGQTINSSQSTVTVDGGVITTNCTAVVKSDSVPVRSYTPGSYRGDGIAQLYRNSSTYKANTMRYALANFSDGSVSDEAPARPRQDPSWSTSAGQYISGQKIAKFDFSCSASFTPTSGTVVSIPLQGLVFADAESSNYIQKEEFYVKPLSQTVPSVAPAWQIIERYRSKSCDTSVTADLWKRNTADTHNTLRLGSSSFQCSQVNTSGNGPTAIGFLQGSTSANVELLGGGTSAIALGVVLGVDYGDAPHGSGVVDGITVDYGKAGALTNPTWRGGEIAQPANGAKTTTNVFTRLTAVERGTVNDSNDGHGGTVERIATLETDTPTPYLGSGVTPDGNYPDSNMPADVDMLDDGLAEIPFLTDDYSATGNTLQPGAQFQLAVTCVPRAGVASPVAGWIDWNLNGKFDANEKNNTSGLEVLCPAGGTPANPSQVTLSWTVPADIDNASLAEATYMRVRIGGATETAKLLPTGLTTSGEVEDYRIIRKTPVLDIKKSVSIEQPHAVANDAIAAYTVTFRNVGNGPFNINKKAAVTDNIANVLTYGNLVGNPTLNGKGNLSYISGSSKIDWTSGTEKLLPGESASITYKVKLNNITNLTSDVDKVIKNVAWASNHATMPPNSASCPTSAFPKFAEYKAKFSELSAWCAETEIKMPAFEATKTSNPVTGTVVNSGDEVEYTLTIKNTGHSKGLLAYRDLLVGVLDDAELLAGDAYGNSGIRKDNSAITAILDTNKIVNINGYLEPNKTVTIRYTVRVKETGLGDFVLGNVLTSSSDTECPPVRPRGNGDASTVLCTEHPVGKPSALTVVKVEKDVAGNVVSNAASGWSFTGAVTGKARLITEDGGKASALGTTVQDKTLGWMIQNDQDNTTDVTVNETENAKPGYTIVGHHCSATVKDSRITGIGSGISYESNEHDLTPGAVAKIEEVVPGTLVDCVFVNQQIAGTVSWTKVSAMDPTELLPGSVWSLSRITGGTDDEPETEPVHPEIFDCAPTQDEATADCTGLLDQNPAAGEFHIVGLSWGDYLLSETQAPVGYVIADEPFSFSIGANEQNTVQLEANLGAIENRSRAVLAVPLTGGLGAWTFPLYGAGIAGLSFLAFGLKRRFSANTK